ncbi:MAG: hypothetical protein HQ490_01900 [Lutibacter sp.]|nr:hypothetical protein [Lutibacter sp.]
MATILQQINNLKKLKSSLVVEKVFQALKEAENKVIVYNRNQLSKGQDVDGKEVGKYSEHTQTFATRDGILTDKPYNNPYNFNWTGEFLKGFEISVTNKDATIFSTGIGSGEKASFLLSENLFGLNEENLKKVIKEDILPFIQKYAKSVLQI